MAWPSRGRLATGEYGGRTPGPSTGEGCVRPSGPPPRPSRRRLLCPAARDPGGLARRRRRVLAGLPDPAVAAIAPVARLPDDRRPYPAAAAEPIRLCGGGGGPGATDRGHLLLRRRLDDDLGRALRRLIASAADQRQHGWQSNRMLDTSDLLISTCPVAVHPDVPPDGCCAQCPGSQTACGVGPLDILAGRPAQLAPSHIQWPGCQYITCASVGGAAGMVSTRGGGGALGAMMTWDCTGTGAGWMTCTDCARADAVPAARMQCRNCQVNSSR